MKHALALTVGGNELGLYDYLAFVVVAVCVAGFLALAVFMLGLPGRLAIARKHPDAEAVNVMGWVGFLAVVPWIPGLHVGIQAHGCRRRAPVPSAGAGG